MPDPSPGSQSPAPGSQPPAPGPRKCEGDIRRGAVVRIDWPDGSTSTGTFLAEDVAGFGGRRFARVLEDDNHPYCDPDEDVVRVPLQWLTFRARKKSAD